MNILVTGGAGFIGSHVTKLLLDSGHEVVVVDNLSCGKRENVDSRAQFIEADIRSIPDHAFKNVDSVIHMAGLIIVPESVEDPIKYADNNVIGTIDLLESMRKNDVKKIIFSSSACVYGTPATLPIKEDAPVHPDNPYGASKASIEAFLQAYNANFNFDVTILRYFNPYGPGEMHEPETHAIPNFIKAALAKKPIPLYWNGGQVRDFIYIEDLARAHVDVINQTGFNIFNIGTEKGVVVKDVLEEIFNIVGYEVPINDLGKRPGDVQANYASSEKLKKAVGWQAKVSLKEGLKKTIDFYRSLL
ncbi:MAG: UDP-glucose 4-epimerase [Candidatus Curtissbacteria bacterium GW2011_GWA1_40_16]|uniref:UDP-glucose 4-epimerase n=1 Tax=Candidatus Curtissbacteria bacterium GW2011_GWA1_40_16 TaxID=1618405 RepID=A0A0G0UMF0_9BACT|nr:MAG: UDP-glucose 4-epimerase [Candidatus Curtissbacteria bacterium GW2011_GWA1_40_16]